MTDRDCATISAGSDSGATETDSSSTLRLDEILDEIRKEILRQQSVGEKSAEEIGRLLLEVKKLVKKKDGNWIDWVKTNTDIPVYKAQRLMRVAKRFQNATPESELPFTHKYILTRIPSDSFAEFFSTEHEVESGEKKRVEAMSKRELEKAVSNFLKSLGKSKEKTAGTEASASQPTKPLFDKRLSGVQSGIKELVELVEAETDSKNREILASKLAALLENAIEMIPESKE